MKDCSDSTRKSKYTKKLLGVFFKSKLLFSMNCCMQKNSKHIIDIGHCGNDKKMKCRWKINRWDAVNRKATRRKDKLEESKNSWSEKKQKKNIFAVQMSK